MENKGLNVWKNIYRVIGVIISFSPFIRNLMFHFGITEVKHPLDLSDGIFIVLGFVFVWGSKNFGGWSNSLGKALVDKVAKK